LKPENQTQKSNLKIKPEIETHGPKSNPKIKPKNET
jgi:hypothetical protein